jgi:hypothetical protein
MKAIASGGRLRRPASLPRMLSSLATFEDSHIYPDGSKRWFQSAIVEDGAPAGPLLPARQAWLAETACVGSGALRCVVPPTMPNQTSRSIIRHSPVALKQALHRPLRYILKECEHTTTPSQVEIIPVTSPLVTLNQFERSTRYFECARHNEPTEHASPAILRNCLRTFRWFSRDDALRSLKVFRRQRHPAPMTAHISRPHQ